MPAVLDVALNVISPVFLIVGIAALASRWLHPDAHTLSSLLVYVLIPFLVLDGTVNSAVRANETGQIGVMVALVAVVMALIAWGISRLLRLDRRLEGAFIVSVILVNAANFGLPLNEFAFGSQGRERAMIYYVASVIVSNSLGVYLASRGTATVRRALLNVIKVPIVYAAALGLALNFANVSLPLPVARTVSILGQAAVPVMLILLGLQLARTPFSGRLRPILAATAAKVVIAPLVAFALAALLGLSGLTRQVSILESSMPTAVMASALATEFGSDSAFTSAVILVSTLTSLVTLSILITVL